MTLETKRLLSRVALIPVFVGICYVLPWQWLRLFTTDTLVWISAMLRIPMHRIGWDVVAIKDMQAQFTVACTMIDAYFGAIPLLWRRKMGIGSNLLRLGCVFVGVFVLNIVRLELGFVGLHFGMPWWLAHECVAGFAYFALFLFIVHDWRRCERQCNAALVASAG